MREQRFNPLAAEAAELHKKIKGAERTLVKEKTHENALRVQKAKRLHQQKVDESRADFKVVE